MIGTWKHGNKGNKGANWDVEAPGSLVDMCARNFRLHCTSRSDVATAVGGVGSTGDSDASSVSETGEKIGALAPFEKDGDTARTQWSIARSWDRHPLAEEVQECDGLRCNFSGTNEFWLKVSAFSRYITSHTLASQASWVV